MTERSSGAGRRGFLKGIAATSLVGAAGGGPALAQPAAQAPNILFVFTDQERYHARWPAGLSLPGHERMERTGTTFANHQCPATMCTSSRSVIVTGLQTADNGMYENLDVPWMQSLSTGHPTIGHMLRKAGYYTAYKGKWHLSDVPAGGNVRYGPFHGARMALEPYGFSDYSDNGIADGATWSGFKLDGEVASAACQWLHDRGTSLGQPWLLAVNFVNPHDIVFFDDADHQQSRTRLDPDFLSPLAPPPFEGVYTKQWDLPLPRSYYADDLSTKPWAHRSYLEFCNMLFGRIDPKDEPRWRHYQSYYYNCIRDVDAHALTVLRTLEQLGLDDNTIVVYTADHGEMLGAHGLRQKGPTMYKENVRVPFIVRHPDAKAGAATQALASAIDLVPTLLSFAGLSEQLRAEKYPALKGVDLSAAVADANARTERDRRGHLYDYNTTLYIDPDAARHVMAAHEDATWWAVFKANLAEGHLGPRLDHPGLFRGVHDGRYKFARYFKPKEHHIPKDWDTLLKHNQLELYDTQTDPDEIVNLAAEPERHKELILALNQKTNALIMDEIGFDDGREQVGPDFLYRL